MIEPSRKILTLTLMVFVLILLNSYFFILLNELFFHFPNSGNDLENRPFSEKFLIGVVVAPLLETFFAQYLLIKLLRIKIKNQTYLLLLSSLFFASMHYYNWLYVLVTFFSGLALNYYYLEIEKISKYSFLLTAMVHSLYNLYGLLFTT